MGNENKIKILIDTDLGDDVDDSAALIMAMNSPEFDIVGITTVFHDTQKRAEMVLELCQMYGRNDIPVYAGRRSALIEKTKANEQPIQYEILRNSQTDKIKSNVSAAEFMIQMVKTYDDLVILEMGMMTNLAIAFVLEPEIMKNAHIIGMGGIFNEALPEWNILCDPEAARIVTDQADYLKLFGLDVTKYCIVSDKKMKILCRNERIEYYQEGVNIFQNKLGYSIKLHDAILIAYLLRPEIAKMEKCDYTIELSGEHTRAAIVKKINAYEINQISEKEFYYAKELNLELFFRLVEERLK